VNVTVGGGGGAGCRLVRGKWQGWRHWRQWHWHPAANSFCSSSGSGVVVKEGRKKAMLPPRGGFVVVVVVAADKECGGNEGNWRRQRFSRLAAYAVVKMRRTIPG